MAEEQVAGPSADGEWLTVPVAAPRPGVSPRAIRGRISRGTIEWKPAGNAGKLVLVRPGKASADPTADDPGDELDFLRAELLEARVAQARAEERAAALRELVDELRALVDELRAELVEARKPWWRRWR